MERYDWIDTKKLYHGLYDDWSLQISGGESRRRAGAILSERKKTFFNFPGSNNSIKVSVASAEKRGGTRKQLQVRRRLAT